MTASETVRIVRIARFLGRRVLECASDRGYRVLAIREGNTFYWFWIGPHDEYERIEVVLVPVGELLQRIANGEIVSSSGVAAILFALNKLS